MIDLPVGPSKRERPLSLEHETPRLPVPLKDDIDNGSAFQTPDSGSVDLAESDTDEKPLLKARNRSRSVFAAEPDLNIETAVIDWLRARAESREGYDQYMASHNRPLHNPDVVKYWDFAAKFFAVYKKANSNVRTRVCTSILSFRPSKHLLISPISETELLKCKTVTLRLCLG